MLLYQKYDNMEKHFNFSQSWASDLRISSFYQSTVLHATNWAIVQFLDAQICFAILKSQPKMFIKYFNMIFTPTKTLFWTIDPTPKVFHTIKEQD